MILKKSVTKTSVRDGEDGKPSVILKKSVTKTGIGDGENGKGEMEIYSNRPVKIPDIKGKIVIRKKKDSKYVMYETWRRYDKFKKYNVVSRICIGIQIPARPEYMLPNENYFRMITEENRIMNENEQEALDEFEFERAQAFMMRDFFEQMYYEFQYQSRRQPNMVLNEYKVRKLNKILEPLKEMMKEEPGAEWLEVIPEPVEEEVEGGGTVIRGMTYSDVMMVLTQFRCLEGAYFQKLLIG